MRGKKICIKCKKEFYPLRKDNKTLGKKQFEGRKYCSYRCAHLGKKLSEYHKRRIKETHKGMLGKHHSEQTKKKMSEANKGEKSPNWRKYFSKETRKKMSKAHKREKSNFWKGGISLLPDYRRYQCHLRILRKKQVGGFHTLAEWENLKAQYNWTCPACKKQEPEIKLAEDHIIPISKGGSDNIENIQPLCKSCNSKKMTKIIKYEILLSKMRKKKGTKTLYALRGL